MFCRTVWFFVVLCGYVNTEEPSTLNKNSFSQIQVKYPIFQKGRQYTTFSAIKNGERMKRGIVMVDSDFDIPSEIYTYENNAKTDDIFGKNEGSGTDDDKESSKTTKGDIKEEPEYYRTTNKTAVLAQHSTKAEEQIISENINKNIATPTEAEGSGADIVSFTEEDSTTKATTKSFVKPGQGVPEKIPDVCMNSTCSTDDLSMLISEESCYIPEGINITLSCTSNNSNYNMLYLYKNNGSIYFLQAFSTDEELHFSIPDSKSLHSGTYVCIKWVNKQTCCNIQSDLTIYEVPLYQYHLIILGLIAIAGLIICIFLSVRQSMALKIYTKQFAEKHGNVKNQLL